MRGRSSGVIGIRLSDEVIAGIRSYLKEGQTVAGWVKDLVIDRVNTMDLGGKTGVQIRTPSVNATDLGGKIGTQTQTISVNTNKAKQAELQKLIHSIEDEPKVARTRPPLFNPAIHKPGDRVLIKPPYGKKLVEVIVPEAAAEGNAVPKWR